MRRLALFALLLAACGKDGSAPGGDDTAAPDAATSDTDAGLAGCGAVPVAGTCTSDSEVARCVDGAVETETCEAGGACLVLDGAAACHGLAECATVGPLGRCDGDVLWRCDGAPSVTDCAGLGQVCTHVGDTVGYGCVDPASAGAHRVAGTISWEDRELTPGVLGPPTAVPARGTMVAVVDDATDELLVTGSASDDGSYVLHYDSTGSVRVVAYSRSRNTARPARVRNTAGSLHAVGSESFAAGAEPTVDVLVTAASGAGGAWNALASAVRAMDWLRDHGVTTISPVIMYWQQSTGGGSYYQGDGNELHLDGGDGYDDVVALHELGHYFQDEYSASDNPGGPHDGSPADPRLAWGEGGATWFAIAVRGIPYYIDHSTGGGWSVELEDRVHAASPTGAMSQNISEWMVAELMWDVTDGPLDSDGDAFTAGAPIDAMNVLLGYLVAPTASDRGRAGVDLVDWLDGWFVHHGLGACAPLDDVADHHGFPYDFNGPGGACP